MKLWENHGNYGKIMETMGKSWKLWENLFGYNGMGNISHGYSMKVAIL